jgi:multicomponent Na+:H+ antiporter subunit E
MTLSTSGRRPHARPRNSIRTEIPLIVWLVLAWGAIWQDFSIGNLVFGLILALIIVNVFYLPPVRLSGRLNVLWAAWFLVKFLWLIMLGSLEVFWLAVRPGPPPQSAVISVPLRVADDLLVTGVGQVVSLIPGSLVIEVDRRNATIYFHVIDVGSEEAAERFRGSVRRMEELLIRVMGYRDDYRAVRAGTLDEKAAEAPHGVIVHYDGGVDIRDQKEGD